MEIVKDPCTHPRPVVNRHAESSCALDRIACVDCTREATGCETPGLPVALHLDAEPVSLITCPRSRRTRFTHEDADGRPCRTDRRPPPPQGLQAPQAARTGQKARRLHASISGVPPRPPRA